MSSSLADRVWLAYWSLPRGRHGRPESFHRLEQEHHLSNGTIGKIVTGARHTVNTATLIKLSHALEVSTGWLLDGTGNPPVPMGHVPPRDGDNAAAVERSLVVQAPRPLSSDVADQVRAAVELGIEQSCEGDTVQAVLARAILLSSRS